jgi:DNA primase (bacterial type)
VCARVWINFKELRAKLRFEDVLRHYGLTVNRKGQQHQGPCPLPMHQGKPGAPCFSANLDKGIYQCFGCGSSGNVLEFACRMVGSDPKDGDALRAVAVELHQKFPSDSRANEKRDDVQPAMDAKVKVNAPLDFHLKDLDAGHPYLAARKFKRDTMSHFGVGFCSRGLLKGRVAVPLQGDDGKLVGYAGRAVDEKLVSDENPKYQFPSRREMGGNVYELKTPLFLYNGHRLTKQCDGLVVVSGFSAVWWLTQCGFPDVVSTMMTDCSDEQAELIVRKVSQSGRAWLLPNGDRLGEKLARVLLEKLSPYRFVRWAKLESGMKPTHLTADELKEVLAV